MSIVAAKCPVCGRDIGFDEKAEEYTCIFCGSKLMTSALKKEHLSNRPDRERPPVRREIIRSSDEKPKEQPHEKPQAPAPEHAPESELTEEEIKHELERKAGFKQELHDVVKEIDELRAKRAPLENRVKTAKTMSIVGVVIIGAALIGLFLLIDNPSIQRSYVILGGALAGGIGIFTVIFSLVRKKESSSARKKLENRISEKKQKRDILIGRLNKINKKLHIHHDE